METIYTVRQAAAALGVAKSTVLRNLEELPQEMTAIGSYRGQPMNLVTAAGIQRLAMLLSVAKINYEALNEASRSAPSADLSEASEAKQSEAHQEELVAELRDRIRAQEDQITMLGDALAREQEAHARTQDALAAAQALHAARGQEQPGQQVAPPFRELPLCPEEVTKHIRDQPQGGRLTPEQLARVWRKKPEG